MIGGHHLGTRCSFSCAGEILNIAMFENLRMLHHDIEAFVHHLPVLFEVNMVPYLVPIKRMRLPVVEDPAVLRSEGGANDV